MVNELALINLINILMHFAIWQKASKIYNCYIFLFYFVY